jgi:hypothetical protein
LFTPPLSKLPAKYVLRKRAEGRDQRRMGGVRGKGKEERGKRKEERGKRKEERGKRKEERGKRKEERGKKKEEREEREENLIIFLVWRRLFK